MTLKQLSTAPCQQGKSQIVPQRFRSFRHSDCQSVCLGDDGTWSSSAILAGIFGAGIVQIPGALVLLPASGHFIGGTLEFAGHDTHCIDHGPIRGRDPLDHV